MFTRGRLASAAGYSLLEMLVVVSIAGILAAIAVVQIGAVRPGFQGDGAMRVVMAQLNIARDTAIAQRRYVDVNFIGGSRVQVVRRDDPNNAAVTTVLADVALEGGVTFHVLPALGDTPDRFGNSSAITFGTAQAIRFNTEGMLVDRTSGVPVNGSVFLGIPSSTLSHRAVTVLGTTGRVRGFRWDGSRWVQV